MHREDSYIMKFLNHIFNKHRVPAILVLSFLAILLLIRLFSTSLAVSGGPFDPNETLDPDCVPGGTCVVDLPVSGWTDDGTNIRLTTSTDKVGIGISSPAQKFQVQSDAVAGTGTITSSGTAVTGSGTLFDTEIAFEAGDTITSAGQSRIVTLVLGDTDLTVDTAFSPDLAGSSFTFSRPRFRVSSDGQIEAGDLFNNNISIGFQTSDVGNGQSNVFLGTGAGRDNDTGLFNTVIGYQAGLNMEQDGAGLPPANNVLVGTRAGSNLTAGRSNILIGSVVPPSLGEGDDSNILIGSNAGLLFDASTSLSENIFIGPSVMSNLGDYSNPSSPITGNTAIGFQAAKNGMGSKNTLFGYQSGLVTGPGAGEISGDNNVYLGYQAGNRDLIDANASIGTGNIYIGYQAGKDYFGTNKLIIDNSNTATPLLFGDFSSNALTINGDLEITGTCTGCSGSGDTQLYALTVTIPSSLAGTNNDILNSNSEPVTLIASPGTGKYIEIVSGNYFLDNPTTPYATNTIGNILPSTATNNQLNFSFNQSSTTRAKMSLGGNINNIVVDDSIVFKTINGDPTAGDAPITLYLLYRIVSI